MTTLQRRSSSFDSRSVMLFAALTLGGVGALQAQTPPSTPSAQFGPMPSSKADAQPAVKSSSAAAAAFDRADTNKDGQLSAQEASQLPAIGQRFKELDADKNGSLSRAEFEKGVNS